MPSLKSTINNLRNTSLNITSIFYYECNKIVMKSFKDLFELSDSVSLRLCSLSDIQAFKYVGIFMKSDFCIPVVILGCIQCDKPFACMDVEAGCEFNSNLIERLHVSVIFTLPENSERLKKCLKSPSLVEEFIIWGVKIEIWTSGEFVNQEELCCPEMLYTVQTSGTTGLPKTVQVPEEAILPNISHLRFEFNITEDDVILLLTPPTFDPFYIELFLAFTTGAALFIVPAEVRASPHYLLDALFPSDSQPLVTIAQFTPSVFMRWSPAQIRSRVLTRHTSFRVLALGGEKFPSTEFWSACQAPGNCTRLYNLYGTTEVSCWSMIGGLDHTLGTAMSHTLLRIESDDGRLVNNGTGELFIGSKTRVCLVGEEKWQQLPRPTYRSTGDIISIQDGVYRYIGRKDNLVKRWGHRVSLDQVEAVAAECDVVAAACCMLHTGSLVLFVSLHSLHLEMDAVKARLKALLLHRLNKASVPDIILLKDHLPLTKHGKINKNKLKILINNPEIHFEKSADLYKALWKKYTFDEVEENVGFLSAGGNSVAAMQIVNGMADRGIDLPLVVLSEMLNNRSFQKCCQLVRTLRISQEENVPVRKRVIKNDDESILKKVKIDSDPVDDVLFVLMKGCSCYLLENIEEKAQLRIAWSYNLKKCVDASPTCIVYSSGKCYVLIGSHSGRMAALDVRSGIVIWEIQLPDRIESSLSPSQCGTRGLIGCYDHSVYCLSLTTGTILWSYKTQAMVKGVPVVVADFWIFGSYDYYVYCLRVHDGEVKWKYKLDGLVLATPLHLPTLGFVVVASLTGQVNALNCETAALMWCRTLPSPVFSSPCSVAGFVLVAEVAGTVHALQQETGAPVWQFQADNKIFSSIVARENAVVFGCHDSCVYCLSCGQTAASLLWTHNMGSVVYATPCLLTPNHLAVASVAGEVSILHLDSGRAVSTIKLLGQLFSSPVASRDSIVIGCRDNYVYSLVMN